MYLKKLEFKTWGGNPMLIMAKLFVFTSFLVCTRKTVIFFLSNHRLSYPIFWLISSLLRFFGQN